jgi:hypothetical protein
VPVSMGQKGRLRRHQSRHSVMFAIKFGAAAVQPSGNYDGLPRASGAVQRRLERRKSDQ